MGARGQTRIVNVDRLSGPPVSIELTNVPEAQALDTLLRAVSGYLAAPSRRRAECVGLRSHLHPADQHRNAGANGHLTCDALAHVHAAAIRCSAAGRPVQR